MSRFLCALFAILFLSCKDHQQKNQPEKNIMVEQSEMAALMLNMYSINQANKKMVLEGKLPGNFPKNFTNIHNAVLTSPSDRDEAFNAYSNFYLANVKAFYNTSNLDSLVLNHNKVISSCITCHEVKCTGPIPKIKKLLIKE